MKEYNRKKRIWEEVEKPVGDLKKPKTCKGGKEHNFVLLTPKYIHKDHNLSKDEIEKYYQFEQERLDYEKMLSEKMLSIGVKSYRYFERNQKFYKCSVCGKEKYE